MFRLRLWALAFAPFVFASNHAVADESLATELEASGPEMSPRAPDENVARAREAFRLGSALARQGQWTEALAAFERSAHHHSHPVTTYNLGYVERALGRYTRARKLLTMALEDSSGALPEELATQARGYLAEAERKIARVAVTVGDGVEGVTLGGRPLEILPGTPEGRPVLVAGTAEAGAPFAALPPAFDLLVDPGAHVLVLTPRNGSDIVRSETFEAGSQSLLRLEVPPPTPSSEVARSEPMGGADVGSSDADVSSGRTWAWIAYGLGGAGLIAGATFGGLAFAQCDRDARACDTQSDKDRLGLYANAATIGFAVAGIGAVAGTVLLLTVPGESTEPRGPRQPDRGYAGVWIGPGSAGVAGRF
jgi:hypothetical protein